MAARGDLLWRSGSDGHGVDGVAPGFAIKATADVRDLQSVWPDLGIAQRRDFRNDVDGPWLGCSADAGKRRQNHQQAKPGCL